MLAYRPFDAPHPYAETGPIFLHKPHAEAFDFEMVHESGHRPPNGLPMSRGPTWEPPPPTGAALRMPPERGVPPAQGTSAPLACCTACSPVPSEKPHPVGLAHDANGEAFLTHFHCLLDLASVCGMNPVFAADRSDDEEVRLLSGGGQCGCAAL